MKEANLDAAVRPWGNSMGIVIPADVARRLNLRPGESVHVRLQYTPGRNNADSFPKWDFVTDVDIDAVLEDEFEA